jgi:CubicO group peptidase (beta-lactamase class C family)
VTPPWNRSWSAPGSQIDARPDRSRRHASHPYYGFADLASREPLTPDTLFEIGSIGKTFTAVAILQLFDEGRIDLHSPIERYLPWFVVPQPAGHGPITVAHLLDGPGQDREAEEGSSLAQLR